MPAAPLRQAVPLIAVACAAAVAAPALAYLPPASAVLRREAQRRYDLKAAALEIHGTLALEGEAAQRLAAVLGTPATGPELAVPAALMIKAPGRCRLELQPAAAAPGTRPALVLKGGKVTGQHGLEAVAPARALLEGLCTLLGDAGATGNDADRGVAQRLAAHRIALAEVALGRVDGRLAWVIGGRPQSSQPQAWIDKLTYQPLRLQAPLGGAPRDVRLVDWGTGPGGDFFPRLVEVSAAGQLEARYTTVTVTPNPRLPDTLF